MLTKSYSSTGKKCKVTFKLAAELNAETAVLCGEFNDWDPNAHPMKKLKDGSFSVTVSLDAGQSYRFRYLLNDGQWENDEEADEYVANQHGSQDCVVTV